ncbi:MAG TPA: hypothetical protein VLW47_08120, partial [Thermodesulfobacteriota bacterium]|nr:hypothetical protein [Thermodesulfobacteriota bacterium]
MIDREQALRLLKKMVRESVADQTEAILLTEDSSLTRFAGSAIHQHVAERNQTAILRVVLGKKIAVVTTNIFQPSSLRKLLRKAISLAKVQQPNEDFVSLPGPKPVSEIETFSKNTSRLTPNQKVKMTKSLLRQAKEEGCRASGAFSNGEVELAVVNSTGVEVYQRFSDLFLHVIVENDKTSGYASFVARDPDQLDVDALV